MYHKLPQMQKTHTQKMHYLEKGNERLANSGAYQQSRKCGANCSPNLRANPVLGGVIRPSFTRTRCSYLVGAWEIFIRMMFMNTISVSFCFYVSDEFGKEIFGNLTGVCV